MPVYKVDDRIISSYSYPHGYGVVFNVMAVISSTAIPSSLTHFPLPVFINSSSGLNNTNLTNIFDVLGEDYFKLRVFDGDGNRLFVEVETWDIITKQALLWVSSSSFVIKHDKDTYIDIYYSKSFTRDAYYIGLAGSAQATSVWDSNFVNVFNFSDNVVGGTPCIIDSTANSNGTPSVDLTNSDKILFNGMAGFNLDEPTKSVSYLTPNTTQTAVTMEAFHKPASAPSSSYTRSLYIRGYCYITYDHPDSAFMGTATAYINGRWRSAGALSFTADQYVYPVTTYNGTSLISYKDGVLSKSANYSGTINASSTGVVGQPITELFFTRASNVVRSVDYLITTHKAIFDNLITFSVIS